MRTLMAVLVAVAISAAGFSSGGADLSLCSSFHVRSLGMGGTLSFISTDPFFMLLRPTGGQPTGGTWLSVSSIGGTIEAGIALEEIRSIAAGLNLGSYALGLTWLKMSETPTTPGSGMLMGSVGAWVSETTSLGLNVKYHVGSEEGKGDLGLLYDVAVKISVDTDIDVSVVIEDIGGSPDGEGKRPKPIYRAGLSLQMLDDSLTFSANLNLIGSQTRSPELRAGLEFNPLAGLSLRAGVVAPEVRETTLEYSLGLGMTILDLDLDAAYLSVRESEGSLVLSVTYRLSSALTDR